MGIGCFLLDTMPICHQICWWYVWAKSILASSEYNIEFCGLLSLVFFMQTSQTACYNKQLLWKWCLIDNFKHDSIKNPLHCLYCIFISITWLVQVKLVHIFPNVILFYMCATSYLVKCIYGLIVKILTGMCQ